MMYSAVKVVAGAVLGGTIVLSALTWAGDEDLSAAVTKGESFKEKTIQVIDSLNDTKNKLKETEGLLANAGLENDELTKSINDLNQQLGELQKNYNELVAKDSASKAEIESLKEQVETAKTTIGSLQDELATVKAEKAETEEALKAAQDKLKEIEENYDNLYEALEYTNVIVFERYQEIQRLNDELTKANEEIKKANQAASEHKDNMDEVLDESIFDEVLSK
ncbi:hypothetical protein [Bacillus testis]|uniref:hypothetical protein n=1 Tax=Bacillus testis TaxID=1622072 RepID=UPI00067F1C8A|nr:hypothetical protein [Bacillus testis]